MKKTNKILKKLFMFGGSTEQNLKFLQALKNIGTFGNSSADDIATMILNQNIDSIGGTLRVIEENIQDVLPEYGSDNYRQLVDNGTISTIENFGKMFNNNYYEAFASLKDWYSELSKTKKLAFDMYGNFVLADRAKVDIAPPTTQDLLIREVNRSIDGAVVAGTALNNSNLAEILRQNKGNWSNEFYNAYRDEFKKRIKAAAMAGVTDNVNDKIKSDVIKSEVLEGDFKEIKTLANGQIFGGGTAGAAVLRVLDNLKRDPRVNIGIVDVSDQLGTKPTKTAPKRAKKGIAKFLSLIFKKKI